MERYLTDLVREVGALLDSVGACLLPLALYDTARFTMTDAPRYHHLLDVFGEPFWTHARDHCRPGERGRRRRGAGVPRLRSGDALLPLYMGLSVASPFRMGRSNGVAWEEARRFAAWAGCRLPTEAEWEYACRAGTPDPRYGDIERMGWYRGNSGAALHPVGEKEPNAWGFYDMLGNAWEWVEDDFHSGYTGAPDDGRAWCDAPRQPRHVLRGGSWADAPHVLRAATRLNDHPGPRIANVGFRLA